MAARTQGVEPPEAKISTWVMVRQAVQRAPPEGKTSARKKSQAVRYPAGTISWPQEEIDAMDVKAGTPKVRHPEPLCKEEG